MMKSIFSLVLIALFVFSACNAYSVSKSCDLVNGKWICTESVNPNGNSASANSWSNGNRGYEYANSYPMRPAPPNRADDLAWY